MSDFPDASILPLSVSTVGQSALMQRAIGNTNGSANQAWTQNKAVYVPVSLPYAFPVNRVWWGMSGAVVGNNDFGIYTDDGTRIYSTGSTAQAGASAIQYVSPTPFVLPAGNYYFAMSADTGGGTQYIYGWSTVTALQMRVAGVLEQSSAFPLPATATFATATGTSLPFCGITRTSSGF